MELARGDLNPEVLKYALAAEGLRHAVDVQSGARCRAPDCRGRSRRLALLRAPELLEALLERTGLPYHTPEFWLALVSLIEPMFARVKIRSGIVLRDGRPRREHPQDLVGVGPALVVDVVADLGVDLLVVLEVGQPRDRGGRVRDLEAVRLAREADALGRRSQIVLELRVVVLDARVLLDLGLDPL